LGDIAYVNGTFCELDQARVSVEDRGFQFGDSVYEGITTYGGEPFLLAEHLRRLRNSARAIHLPVPLSDEQITEVVREGVRRSGFDDVHIYMQLTRGVASRSHAFPAGAEPTVVMTFKAAIRVPADVRAQGVALMSRPDNRWGWCNVKTVMLLPNVLAKQEALDRGAYDALFVGPDQVVYEASSSNVFLVRAGEVWTPQRSDKILPGITCDYIVESLPQLGIPGGGRVVCLNDVLKAEEVFLAGTTTETLGVVSVDGKPIGDGRVGPVTRRFYEELFASRGR
jgi:D-alanine transaminase